uniref:Uncharacterized protein n=1 Tax=Romanomermis culicivorax TaxID=13658 RepID=A0A915KLJ4_ROMCU
MQSKLSISVFLTGKVAKRAAGQRRMHDGRRRRRRRRGEMSRRRAAQRRRRCSTARTKRLTLWATDAFKKSLHPYPRSQCSHQIMLCVRTDFNSKNGMDDLEIRPSTTKN